jgi:hypothetical protein
VDRPAAAAPCRTLTSLGDTPRCPITALLLLSAFNVIQLH